MARKNSGQKKRNKRNQMRRRETFNHLATLNYNSPDIEGDAIKLFGIPNVFPQDVMDEVAEIVKHQSDPKELLKDPERDDLTHIPFMTIDGEDARDFDDAVYAYPDPDPANKDGHILHVAIADVSHYVRPGSAVDAEAKRRGTSVYLPGQVIPMLPEELSNGLCSLKPNEYRACAAYKIKISAEGKILGADDFQVGVMKSVARLTYNQVLSQLEGNPDPALKAVNTTHIDNLNNVFKSLAKARSDRNAVEFDFAETNIRFDHKTGQGPFFSVLRGDDAHSLIEEAMIAANNRAAYDQATKGTYGVYRTQLPPFAKVPSPDYKGPGPLSILKRLGVPTSSSVTYEQEISQKTFKILLKEAESSKDPEYARNIILRMQQKALYTSANHGHYCLALDNYSHFTSPIRRYPDLLVHRNLKAIFNKSAGVALDASVDKDLEHCVDTERRAKKISGMVNTLYTYKYLHDFNGKALKAEITSVSKQNGLRILIKECNFALSILPHQLPDGAYELDTQKKRLVNKQTGHCFTKGDTPDVTVHFRWADGQDQPMVLISDLDSFRKPRPNQKP